MRSNANDRALSDEVQLIRAPGLLLLYRKLCTAIMLAMVCASKYNDQQYEVQSQRIRHGVPGTKLIAKLYDGVKLGEVYNG